MNIYDAVRQDFVAGNRSTNHLRIMLIYRLGHASHVRRQESIGWRAVSVALTRLQKWLVFYPFGIEMPFSADIGPGLFMPHPNGIVISGHAKIGSDVTIFHQVTLGVPRLGSQAAPIIADNVVIGAGAKLLGNVKVGVGSRIGANAVISRDVPPGAAVVGANRLVLRSRAQSD